MVVKVRLLITMVGLLLLSGCNSKSGFEIDDTINFRLYFDKSNKLRVSDLCEEAFDYVYVFYPNTDLNTSIWRGVDEMGDRFGVDFSGLRETNIGADKDYTVLVFFKEKKYVSQVDINSGAVRFLDPNYSSLDMYIAGYHNDKFHSSSEYVFFLKKSDREYFVGFSGDYISEEGVMLSPLLAED